MFHLKPSEIRYSQDSINNFFDSKCNHSYKMIGETLDDICENRCSVYDIPTLRVVLLDGKWTTSDNRRLWVFRHLERLGKRSEIPVVESYYIPDAKLTSQNDGVSIRVRGHPGGTWHRKPIKPSLPSQRSSHLHDWLTSTDFGYGNINNGNRSFPSSARSQHLYNDRSQIEYSHDRSNIGYRHGFAATNGYPSNASRVTRQESYTSYGRSSPRVFDGYGSGTTRSDYKTSEQSATRNNSWCNIL